MNDGFIILLGIIMYFVTCYPMYRLAQKANYEYAFFAFIPILNILLIINIGGMNGWFILLMLIPLVNIVFSIVVNYKFYASYESGELVFFIHIIVGFMVIFFPVLILIATIATWWLALSEKEFIGKVWGT